MNIFRQLMMTNSNTKKEYIKFADKEVERICIENFSFDGVGVTLNDAENVKDLGLLFKNNAIIKSFDELKYFKNVKVLKETAFLSCSSLESINLDNIESMGYWCFSSCNSLNIISMPNLIEFIRDADSTFFKSGVKYVNNLGKITKLSTGTFRQCPRLIKVDIPATVKELGKFVFDSSSVQTIICRAEVPPKTWIEGSFGWVDKLKSIYVPDASIDAYKIAADWSRFADKIKPLSTYVPQ